MLKVFYGPFQPALESGFIDRLRELRRNDPYAPIAIVTPSRRMADRLQRLAASKFGLPLLGAHFHTFFSLAMGVLQESSAPKKALLRDRLFHDRLIDWILSNDKELGSRFGGAGRPKALASALRGSIRDLVDAGVSPADVREHFDEGLLASTRLKDLLDLQAAYLERLDGIGVLSTSGLTTAAISAVEESPFLARFLEVIYYGFYDLTGLQSDFFERVTGAYPSTLFFPHIPGNPAFRFCDDFFNVKLHRGGAPEPLLPSSFPGGKDKDRKDRQRAPTPISRAKSQGSPTAAPAESFFSSLFAGGRDREANGSPEVRIVDAPGARDELWWVAKEILRLVEDEGFAFDSIGVVARTLDPYRAHAAQIFGENAIPAAMTEGEPLIRHPFAKISLTLLTLAERKFPAHGVADVLHSPYLRLDRTCDPKAQRRLRAVVSRHVERLHIAGGWLAWEAKLRAAGALGPDEGDVPPDDAREMLKVLDALRKELLSDGALRGWRHWVSEARILLDRWMALSADPSVAELAAQEAFGKLLDELREFEPLGAVSWGFFLDTLAEKSAVAQLPAESRRGVRVLNSMDARGESFRALFLIGLQEGMFPRQVREDPLLKDNIRARLKHPGGYWISQKLSGYEEERLLFALNVLSARERLYCVYCRSDEDGKIKAPSIYLRDLCRSVGIDVNRDSEHVLRQPALKLSRCPAGLLSKQESAVLSCMQGTKSSEHIRLLNEWSAPGALDGLIGRPTGYLSKLAKAGLSPTALERFSTCPFRFFASDVLKMGEAESEPDQGSIEPKIRGEIYHKILERFYRELRGSGYWQVKPRRQWGTLLEKEIDKVFSEYGWNVLGIYPLVWKAARNAMGRAITRFVEWDMARIQETGLIPELFEEELRGALSLQTRQQTKEVQFHGRADRIDIDRGSGRYRVVDYKTSWRRFGSRRLPNLVLSGRHYQLPVYGELAASMKDCGTFEEACCYLIEDSSEETGRDRLQSYSAESWSRDREDVFGGISIILDEISDGRFPIRPEDDEYGYCRYCSYASICRKSHGPSRHRAELAYEGSGLKKIHDRKISRAAGNASS